MEWEDVINREKKKEYMRRLAGIVKQARTETVVYPEEANVFRAFAMTPFNEVKVVILGQDPYHDGNADGLAFSCKKNLSPSIVKITESILTTTTATITSFMTASVDWNKPFVLDCWAMQGVLLLNTVLTVEKGDPLSHARLGWEDFTDVVIRELLLDAQPKCFLLWGKVAIDRFTSIFASVRGTLEHIYVKAAEHPAAAARVGRTWKNNDCFNVANGFLFTKGREPINWLI